MSRFHGTGMLIRPQYKSTAPQETERCSRCRMRVQRAAPRCVDGGAARRRQNAAMRVALTASPSALLSLWLLTFLFLRRTSANFRSSPRAAAPTTASVCASRPSMCSSECPRFVLSVRSRPLTSWPSVSPSSTLFPYFRRRLFHSHPHRTRLHSPWRRRSKRV